MAIFAYVLTSCEDVNVGLVNADNKEKAEDEIKIIHKSFFDDTHEEDIHEFSVIEVNQNLCDDECPNYILYNN